MEGRAEGHRVTVNPDYHRKIKRSVSEENHILDIPGLRPVPILV